MKSLLIRVFIICLLPLSLSAQTDTVLFEGLSGDSLVSQLQGNFTARRVLTYNAARDVMYSRIYNVNDSVSCVYTGHTLYVDPNEDPSTFIFQNGSDNGINAEHTWPRSFGADSGSPLADMHHLFPTRALVNEVRSNNPFAELDDDDTDFWYIDNQQLRNKPTSRIDEHSEFKFGFFEPREDHKGNVARAMFYFYTIYRDAAGASGANFFDEQRETLCNWHYLDPVDSLEYERTFEIARFQDRKTNPFVLDCSLAKRTYCEDIDNSCASVVVNTQDELAPQVSQFKVFPNPTSGESRIEFELKNNAQVALELTNMLGQSINIRSGEQLTAGEYQWDININDPGLYTVILKVIKDGQQRVFPKRILVR